MGCVIASAFSPGTSNLISSCRGDTMTVLHPNFCLGIWKYFKICNEYEILQHYLVFTSVRVRTRSSFQHLVSPSGQCSKIALSTTWLNLADRARGPCVSCRHQNFPQQPEDIPHLFYSQNLATDNARRSLTSLPMFHNSKSL